jgi:AraC family transcriptional regulator
MAHGWMLQAEGEPGPAKCISESCDTCPGPLFQAGNEWYLEDVIDLVFNHVATADTRPEGRLDLSDAPSQTKLDARPAGAESGRGLAFCNGATWAAPPKYWRDHVIAPVRTIGGDAGTSLKVSFWHSTVEDSPQASEPAFISASIRTSEARAWRDAQPSGVVSMLPFAGAQWRFEQPVSFTQVHLPFSLTAMVCGALFDRELVHDDLSMPADVGDVQFNSVLQSIRRRIQKIEPTNLLLDSWALIMSETMLRRMSSHAGRSARASFGKVSGRGIARVVDYVEAGIDQDLRLSSLADVAAMSTYHFARSFRETVGMSPHAYVLSRRVVRARAMLGRTDNSLAEIALACGFSSQAHLTTAFRRGLGVTPGGYRREIML